MLILKRVCTRSNAKLTVKGRLSGAPVQLLKNCVSVFEDEHAANPVCRHYSNTSCCKHQMYCLFANLLYHDLIQPLNNVSVKQNVWCSLLCCTQFSTCSIYHVPLMIMIS